MSVTESTSIQEWPWFITPKPTVINVILNSARPTGITVKIADTYQLSEYRMQVTI